MTPLARAGGLISVPYLRRGVDLDGWDCMGCVRWVRTEIFAQPWRSPQMAYGDAESADPAVRAAAIAANLGDWTLVGDKRADMRPGAVLLFQYFGSPSHVGVALTPSDFIHCIGGVGTAIVDFDREPQWERRLRGIYD